MLTWAQIRNVAGASGSDGGIFLDGARDVREPGADGLMNTTDDGALAEVIKPGPDGSARHVRRRTHAAVRIHPRDRDSRPRAVAAAAARHRDAIAPPTDRDSSS